MYVPTALGVERRGDRDTGNEFLSHARNNIGIVDALMGFALAHLRHQQSPLDVAKPVPKGARMDDATPLFFPQLGPVYQALFPWVEMLLRALVGYVGTARTSQHIWDVFFHWRAIAQFDRICR